MKSRSQLYFNGSRLVLGGLHGLGDERWRSWRVVRGGWGELSEQLGLCIEKKFVSLSRKRRWMNGLRFNEWCVNGVDDRGSVDDWDAVIKVIISMRDDIIIRMILLRFNDWGRLVDNVAWLVWSGNWCVDKWSSVDDCWSGDVSSAGDGQDAWCYEL